MEGTSQILPKCNHFIARLKELLQDIYERYYEIQADLFEYKHTLTTFKAQQSRKDSSHFSLPQIPQYEKTADLPEKLETTKKKEENVERVEVQKSCSDDPLSDNFEKFESLLEKVKTQKQKFESLDSTLPALPPENLYNFTSSKQLPSHQQTHFASSPLTSFDVIITNYSNNSLNSDESLITNSSFNCTQTFHFPLPSLLTSEYDQAPIPTENLATDVVPTEIIQQGDEYFIPRLTFIKALSPSTFIVGDDANKTMKLFEFNIVQSPQITKVFPRSCELQNAVDVCVGIRYYSADRGSHTVSIYDKNKRTIACFGGFGKEVGKFCEPSSVCLWGDKLFVSDGLNHRICQFDLRGRFERSIVGGFLYPSCVRINHKNQLLILDEWRGSIVVFDLKTNKCEGVWGIKEKLVRPTYMATYEDEVYVSDTGNKRIVRFKEGNVTGMVELEKIGIDGKPLGIDVSQGEVTITIADSNMVYFINLKLFS
ncbi:hypothetical protein EIN_487960 [Entamoeba invadens IP1]|uniref:Nhl repeat-containing protein n=1 Tax=Entamoeba invadens IP1 TaxID=370355 RepID=A0A0A1U515_ENTIV|nr:hypothetical protein EIN_487960 [Entamoeba invadens IP1]ELP89284.1 hypothetical protein EIN_487960 [Entamoeba invadens IP1]|eukprot:XP_004256055.1 hypothetical protein EIN_487960 [Entamoeba invadens IP1]